MGPRAGDNGSVVNTLSASRTRAQHARRAASTSGRMRSGTRSARVAYRRPGHTSQGTCFRPLYDPGPARGVPRRVDGLLRPERGLFLHPCSPPGKRVPGSGTRHSEGARSATDPPADPPAVWADPDRRPVVRGRQAGASAAEGHTGWPRPAACANGPPRGDQRRGLLLGTSIQWGTLSQRWEKMSGTRRRWPSGSAWGMRMPGKVFEPGPPASPVAT
jgi:hypothetical protein